LIGGMRSGGACQHGGQGGRFQSACRRGGQGP
jgi:hypothetical protein